MTIWEIFGFWNLVALAGLSAMAAYLIDTHGGWK